MAYQWKDSECERLERELQQPVYTELLQNILENTAFTWRLSSWNDVLAFMRQGSANDAEKDCLLRLTLSAYQQDRDQKWGTVLLVIFWPGLKGIQFRKRNWDPDPQEFWQTICLCFLEALWKVRLDRRSSRLVRKVLNDTFHSLYEEYSRVWEATKPEILMDLDGLEEIMGAEDGLEMIEAELRIDQAVKAKGLGSQIREAGLKQVDFDLLAGTRIYGKPLSDCAAETGLSYEAAKKRRQRAEDRLRRL